MPCQRRRRRGSGLLRFNGGLSKIWRIHACDPRHRHVCPRPLQLVIIAGAVLSWLIAFGVVNIRNDFVRCDLEPVPGAHGAVFAPDPQLSAQYRRHRHFADHPAARGDADRAHHHLLRLSLRLLTSGCLLACAGQDRRRPVLRGLSPRRDDPSRDAAHAEQRRRLALFGAHRGALRAAKRGNLRSRHRLSGKPDRRSARLPCRVRQDGGRRLAERGRQPRLRRLPVLEAGFSRRYALRRFAGDRAQGKLEPAERRRLCALARVQSARRDGHRLRPLGDGAKARRERRPRPRPTFPNCPRRSASPISAQACPRIDRAAFDGELSGSPHRFEDYRAGERIDHVDGVTVEEAEHQTATRLYQNAAKVHFNQFSEGQGRFGRRLIYGGHVISLARALEFQRPRQRLPYRGDQRRAGMSRRCSPATPCSPGAKFSRPRRCPAATTSARLRLRTVATKNRPCADFPWREGEGYEPHVVLELDYWALAPRRP